MDILRLVRTLDLTRLCSRSGLPLEILEIVLCQPHAVRAYAGIKSLQKKSHFALAPSAEHAVPAVIVLL